MKKQFNKNILMTVDDEGSFKSSNKCWIYGRLFAEGDNKVRDHDHVTGKYRHSTHGESNINLKWTKEVS